MSLLRRSARNISILAASHVVMWLATFVFTVAQARYLGPARFGELSLALSYAVFLSIVIDFGLGTQLSRMVAQRSGFHDEALADTMLIRGALWLLAMPGLWLVTILLGYERELQEAILILAVSVLFIGVSSTVGAYLQGHEEFLLPSLASVAQRVTAAAVGLSMLVLRPELGAVAVAFVVAAAVNLAVLLVGLRGRLGRPRIDPRIAYGLFRTAIPLGLYWIATTFYFNVDMVMLERLAPAENVGWYAAAYRLFNAATIVPAIVVGSVLYPIFSRLSLGSREELRAVIEKTLTFLTLSGVAVALVFVLFAQPIVAFLYPSHGYAEAANTLRLLAPGLAFLYLNSVLGFSLFGLHQERRLLAMAAAAAILNPLANLVAIPIFRQDGAAITTSLTELALLAWLLRTMPKDLLTRTSLSVAAKAGLAALVGAVVVGAVGEHSLFVMLPLALIAYAATALALRAAPAGDVRALGALLRRARPTAAGMETARPPYEEVA